jgi:hypothetical protein
VEKSSSNKLSICLLQHVEFVVVTVHAIATQRLNVLGGRRNKSGLIVKELAALQPVFTTTGF